MATDGPERMRDGNLELIAGPAYAATRAFPGWKGVRLLCALPQHSYWFLALRSDIQARRGDLQVLKGLRICAAETWPIMGLRHMLVDAGFDLERDNVKLVLSPPAYGDKGYMARNGVDSITQNIADAFWGNGMRVALGESLGIAKLHLDLRRGDGPPGAKYYNFPALTASEKFIDAYPDAARPQSAQLSTRKGSLRKIPRLRQRLVRDCSRLRRLN